jgi:hypothetical protein
VEKHERRKKLVDSQVENAKNFKGDFVKEIRQNNDIWWRKLPWCVQLSKI